MSLKYIFPSPDDLIPEKRIVPIINLSSTILNGTREEKYLIPFFLAPVNLEERLSLRSKIYIYYYIMPI